MITHRGRSEMASRVIYRLKKGEIPPGMCVCHHCDTPACVNLDHLFLGTKRDNNLDRDRKGRLGDRRGDKNGRAKLTNEQILAIRVAKGTQQSIADQYGISQNLVSKIKLRRAWPHL